MRKKLFIIILSVLILVSICFLIQKQIAESPLFQIQKLIEEKHEQKLQEHIDFKNAKTVSQAIDFGNKNLAVKLYIGFSKKDLDVLNWVNEALVNINNKTKGKTVTPFCICYDKTPGKTSAGMINFYMHENKKLKELLGDDGFLIIKSDEVNQYRKLSKKVVNEYKIPLKNREKLLDKINQNHVNARLIYITYLNKHPEELKKLLKNRRIFLAPFSDIYHEIGHLQHQKNIYSDLYRALSNEYIIPKEHSTEARELWNLYKNSADTVKKVTTYAQKSPLEFVAEVYSILMYGIELPDDVIQLYKNLGGAPI